MGSKSSIIREKIQHRQSIQSKIINMILSELSLVDVISLGRLMNDVVTLTCHNMNPYNVTMITWKNKKITFIEKEILSSSTKSINDKLRSLLGDHDDNDIVLYLYLLKSGHTMCIANDVIYCSLSSILITIKKRDIDSITWYSGSVISHEHYRLELNIDYIVINGNVIRFNHQYGRLTIDDSNNRCAMMPIYIVRDRQFLTTNEVSNDVGITLDYILKEYYS